MVYTVIYILCSMNIISTEYFPFVVLLFHQFSHQQPTIFDQCFRQPNRRLQSHSFDSCGDIIHHPAYCQTFHTFVFVEICSALPTFRLYAGSFCDNQTYVFALTHLIRCQRLRGDSFLYCFGALNITLSCLVYSILFRAFTCVRTLCFY